jgi:hypothetical protein
MVQIKNQKWSVQEVHDHWVQQPDPPEHPRAYYLLRLDQDRLCCVFHSPVQGRWYRQRISPKAWAQRIPPQGEQP